MIDFQKFHQFSKTKPNQPTNYITKMPKGANTYNFGGKMRSIECACGWGCRKAIREANKAYERHIKYCAIERTTQEKKEDLAQVPKDANATQCETNGWKGMKGLKNINSQALSVRLGGVMYELIAPKSIRQLPMEVAQNIVELLVKKGKFALTNNYTIKDEDELMTLMLEALMGQGVEVMFA